MKYELQITHLMIDENETLTFEEFCEISREKSDWVLQLIEHDILHPQGGSPHAWSFSGLDVKKLQKAQRLQKDLAINLEGIAVVLALLDEVDELRQALKHWEKLHHSLES